MDHTASEISPNTSEESTTAISRIKKYPVVKDSFSKASEYYNWIKSQNNTLTSTLNWTENVVKDVVQRVEPIAASHLEPLDKYACTKLDNFEEKYPLVKEPSVEVLKSSSEYYESTIKPKVESAKVNVAYVVGTPYRITWQTIEMLSSSANNYVGNYMTATQPKTSTAAVEQKHEVIFTNAVKEINQIRHFTMENIHKLNNLLSSIYNITVTNNEELVRKYYEEYKTEIDSKSVSLSPEMETNSKIMNIALFLSNKVRISVRAMSTVCYTHLSPEYREKLDLVFTKTEQLYNNINKSTFETVREKISMDNLNWVGETSLTILNNVKDTVSQRYKEYNGHEASHEIINDESSVDDHQSTNN